MNDSILVPLDGSAFAEHALPYAIEVSRRCEAPVRLVYVHTPLPHSYPEPFPVHAVPAVAEALEWARLYLNGVTESVRARTNQPVSAQVHVGAVVAGLLAAVDAEPTVLIVLTTHGRGGVSRLWLGSVADELVRSAEAPILAVRPSRRAPDLDTEPSLRRVVVPLDGSAFSEQVLPVVRDVTAWPAAHYTLLHLVPYHIPIEQRSGLGMKGVAEGDEEAEARRWLLESASPLAPAEVDLVVHRISVTHFAEGILREADFAGADLIAMATHGRGGLERLVLGSVADRVLRSTHRPVLLVRPRRAGREWRRRKPAAHAVHTF